MILSIWYHQQKCIPQNQQELADHLHIEQKVMGLVRTKYKGPGMNKK